MAEFLIEVVKGHVPAKVAHPPIHQDLRSDRGRNIGGRGAVEVATVVVALVVVILPKYVDFPHPYSSIIYGMGWL